LDKETYLRRLGGSIRDKLRVVEFIPKVEGTVLDVGCADGTVTKAMALERPEMEFLGVDLSYSSIHNALRSELPVNVDFKRGYLRDLLMEPDRYEAVTFISVLHEFYSYGQGISSVVKALADAHELLKPGGVIIIRDMIFHDYAHKMLLGGDKMYHRIMDTPKGQTLYSKAQEFKGRYGLESFADINHFLLKILYEDNWEHEMKENYTPVTFEQYQDIFRLLGMKLEFWDSYLLNYLAHEWSKRFGLRFEDFRMLRSTGLLVARKK
jgi:2-polyprenyl-3-methyl-5-hydroxy-6-metoxy-1,4-benzoquinol methylase